jgi:predicted RNA binding protein YcfA (HicA-like mRNA interferase family)
MKPVPGKEFAKVLRRNGWVLRRINGSHHIFGKAGTNVRISVPIHGNRLLKAGLQAHLSKLAGLTETDFE